MANLTTSILGSLDELRAIEPEWRSLADDCGAGPFLMPAVVLPWWEHLGRGRPLVIAAHDDGGRLLGLALLHERRFGVIDVVRWMGHGLGAVGEVLVRPSSADTAGAIWNAIGGNRRRVLQLVEYRLGGGGLDELRRNERWHAHPVLRDACPVVDLRGFASVDAFLAEPGRRKLRQNMARHDRQAERSEGKLTIDVHADRAGVEAVLGDLTTVHDRAEAAKERLHHLAGRYRGFTVEVLRRAADEGRLAVFVARLDGRPIGLHVVLTAGRVAYAWLARFDPVAAELSPGHVMLREVVRWAIAHGFDTLDLQLGDDAYKLRWSTGTYDTVGVLAAAPGGLTAARSYLGAIDRGFTMRNRARTALQR